MCSPGRGRGLLRWLARAAFAAICLTLVADCNNGGPWTSPRDLAFVRVTGLPGDVTHIQFLGERNGNFFLLDHYFDEGWFGGPSRKDPGEGWFIRVSAKGEARETMAWEAFDRLGILAAGTGGNWKILWVPVETIRVPSRLIPIRRVQLEFVLDPTTPFQELPEKVKGCPLIRPIPMEGRDY